MVNAAWEGQSQERTRWSSDTDVQIVCYAWRRGRKTNRTISQLFPSAVSLRRAGVEQLYQVKRMIRGTGIMLFSTFSQTWNLKNPMVTFGEHLKHVITPRGHILVSRTDDDSLPSPAPRVSIQNSSVCTFKRPRLYLHHAHMFQHVRVLPAHTVTLWIYTREFSACHTAATATTTHTTDHTTDTTCTPTQHRERQRKKTEKEREKRRQDKGREMKEDFVENMSRTKKKNARWVSS